MNESPPTEVELVYRENSARLWRAVWLYGGDAEIASDAVAEAFAQALARGESIRSVRAWVWRTAFAIAKGLLQERRRAPGQIDPTVGDLPIAEASSALETLQLLEQLSPLQRLTIVLRYYEDRDLRDIARIAGSTPAAVAVHLHRAKRRLRTLLEETE